MLYLAGSAIFCIFYGFSCSDIHFLISCIWLSSHSLWLEGGVCVKGMKVLLAQWLQAQPYLYSWKWCI